MSLFRKPSAIAEHLLFVALLLPTFLLLAAAAVSLAHTDGTIAVPAPLEIADCQACPSAGQ